MPDFSAFLFLAVHLHDCRGGFRIEFAALFGRKFFHAERFERFVIFFQKFFDTLFRFFVEGHRKRPVKAVSDGKDLRDNFRSSVVVRPADLFRLALSYVFAIGSRAEIIVVRFFCFFLHFQKGFFQSRNVRDITAKLFFRFLFGHLIHVVFAFRVFGLLFRRFGLRFGKFFFGYVLFLFFGHVLSFLLYIIMFMFVF